ICEIMNDDGTMARVPDLIRFCEEHQMKMLTVAELIRYRLQHERYISRAGETTIHTRHGEFHMIAYESEVNGGESHIALVKGELCSSGDAHAARPVLVRVHTKCAAGDLFGAECQCREILDESMRTIAEAGCGALLYLHNTGRGFELIPDAKDATAPARLLTHAQLRAHAAADADSCEDHNRRTLRAVGLGGQILYDLGIRRIRLLSNTPLHIPALEGFGLEIVEQVPVPVAGR
ncbi:MAG TPA: 3,4-dihydroxy-2-butanone-4-phosphate synthase, partial [Acidobacteriaceae bacterium]